jgi:hypothetical protein
MCLAAKDAAELGSTQTIANFSDSAGLIVNTSPRGPVEPAFTGENKPVPTASSARSSCD